jgi:hypothetical protein
MPSVVEFTMASSRTNDVVETLKTLEGIIGISVDRGGSIQPPGDVIRVNASNRGARQLSIAFRDPEAWGIASCSISEPLTLVSPKQQAQLDNESSEASWTDVAGHIRQESNPELNILLLMLLSGAVAAVGLATDAPHIVIGAMIIAPGFEPFLRIPFGLIAGPLRSVA